MLFHGGNIYRIAEMTGIVPEKVIDFSASINPIGPSELAITEIKKAIKNLQFYPDPEAKILKKTISELYAIKQDFILCGNGSIELIYLIARALKPSKVLIPVPTFEEYERAVKIAKKEVEITYFHLKSEDFFKIDTELFIKSIPGHDMVFLCNPNNPTATVLHKEELLYIIKAASEHKCYIVIDEAFIDFLPDNTVIKEVEKYPYLIVLRSLTKFYALTGLRIGYGVFPLRLMDRMLAFKEPWTVNTLAIHAASVILIDDKFRKDTFKWLKREKTFIEEGLKKLNIQFFPSVVNFYLLKIKDGKSFVELMKKKGLLLRSCYNFKGLDDSYIRIAVKTRNENKILLHEFRKLLNNDDILKTS